MDDLKSYRYCQTVPCVRSGWPGVWDALKSAVTGSPRVSVAKNIAVEISQVEGGAVTSRILVQE